MSRKLFKKLVLDNCSKSGICELNLIQTQNLSSFKQLRPSNKLAIQSITQKRLFNLKNENLSHTQEEVSLNKN